MPKKRKRKLNIALLYVPRYALRRLFPLDWQGRLDMKDAEAVEASLKKIGHHVFLLPVDGDIFEKLRRLKRRRKIDLIFNLADDGFWGKSQLEPHVAAMLDILKIPYTGSNYFTLATCLNKIRVKEILMHHKIPTPKFQVFYNGKERASKKLRFPLIVKPAREDASIGIKLNSVVKNFTRLRHKVNYIIRRYKQPALVEEYIDGREVHMAVLGEKTLTALPVLELKFDLPEKYPKIFFYETKWVKDSPYYKKISTIYPDNLSADMLRQLKKNTLKAARLLNCKDYARIDFRIQHNIPYVLDINPNPDLNPDAEWIRVGPLSSWGYDKLIKKIVSSARRRFKI